MTSIINALTNGGKRVKIHDSQVVVKLPSAAKALVNKAADTAGITPAAVVRQAIAEWLERRGYRA